LIINQGVNFLNSYVSYSLCCPSRTTFLTGQFMHNHGVMWNFWGESPEYGPVHGGYFGFKHSTNDGGWSNIMPRWLQQAGYHTGLIGKYLNQYGTDDPSTPAKDAKPREIPPGWNEWAGGVDPTTYSYFGYTLNVNGKLKTYGKCEHQSVDVAPGGTESNIKPSNNVLDGCKTTSQHGKDGSEYQTDVEASYAESFISRNAKQHSPYFLWLTPTAPHTTTLTGANEGLPAVPPNRYKTTYSKVSLPNWPSLDEVDVSDKPWLTPYFHWFPPMGDAGKKVATNHLHGRLGAVRGLDDMVARVVAAVKKSGKEKNTIIVYTSDNGWLLGEHRLVGQKFFGFDPSIKVPLYIKGPGFSGGKTVSTPVINTDLPASLIQIAGANPGRTLDGIPLQTLMAHPSDWANRNVLIETGKNTRGAYYEGVHTPRYHLEVIHGGWLPDRYELYDLRSDPNEMNAVTNDPKYMGVLMQLISMTQRLAACKGASCRDTSAAPEPSASPTSISQLGALRGLAP
jgi:arylsulfatase A-like enzyme